MDGERVGMLLMHLGRDVDARLRRQLSVYGLTPRHGYTLSHLCDNGPTSQQSLLDVLDVDPSVLVAILNDLENAGLAERKRDPDDRRRHIVVMSEQGRTALTTMQDTIDTIERELLADLSPADADQLRSLLSKVRSPADTSCTGD
ncbi:MarR family winged helix-turn-helix transcriptional regulator [Lentzea sp. NBC_00516]|uniref:MarR family winged helix-turn-helix transcriptional regulator n=1 Tax=Lentzea sp. NBC_00516 TaxID=2903582 RepID=UPI002E81095D|nr:MarR family winged helix-turn-helix transcriptional regulator [Lentzea sp. NBC_00516]WUD28404.1 MarR family winged helix-turn-helix transcriptional regulator [Lentzea sp. NBC_00516]